MVRKLVATLLALVSLGAVARAGVHLTPEIGEYDLEGAKIKHLVFRVDNSPSVTYSQPAGWSYMGDGVKLTLRPPHNLHAEASVSVQPMAQPGGFDDATVARLRDQVLAAAPEGSTDVTLIEAQKNPLQIGQRETLLVTYSYSLFGERYGRSVMFLNRPEEQMRFELVCRLSDFKALQQAFLESHFTWQNL